MELPWVATVNLESEIQYGKADNKSRFYMIPSIIKKIAKRTTGNRVVLLPAGYLSCHHKLEDCSDFTSMLESRLPEYLMSYGQRSIVICLGIDYGRKRVSLKQRNLSLIQDQETREILISKDQMAYAVGKKGILASGLKFFPTRLERKYINISDISQRKNLEGRTFSLNEKSFFLAVCNDVFSIKKIGFSNAGVDFILTPIHIFTSDHFPYFFARHGLLEASKMWDCKTFGAALFLKRKVENWTPGVRLNSRRKKISMNYSAFKIPEAHQFACDFNFEKMEVTIFI